MDEKIVIKLWKAKFGMPSYFDTPKNLNNIHKPQLIYFLFLINFQNKQSLLPKSHRTINFKIDGN